MEKYTDNDLILAQGVYSEISRKRGNNTLVLGAAGKGKDRFYTEPNILQKNTNYVLVDHGGVLYEKYASFLKEGGYEVYCVDTGVCQNSACFNPFPYLNDENSALSLASILAEDNRDPFYSKLERNTLASLLWYIKDTHLESEQSLMQLYKLFLEELNPSNGKSVYENYVALFKEYKEKTPEGYGNRCFVSILTTMDPPIVTSAISSIARSLDWVVSHHGGAPIFAYPNTLDLDSFRDKKAAIFLVRSTTSTWADSYYEACLFQIYKSCMCNENKNARPVHFILDNFGSYKVFDISMCFSCSRTRGMFTSVLVSDLCQIKNAWKDKFDMLWSNCDNVVCLGFQDPKTLAVISEKLGKYNPGRLQMFARRIITASKCKCVTIRRGGVLRRSKAYNVKNHPRYKKEMDA